MIRISITPYFSSVTCGENKDTVKSRSRVWPCFVCSFISAILLTWSLRSRSMKPGMLLANSVTSRTASTERDWQLLKKRSSSSSDTLPSDPQWAPVRPVFGWDVWFDSQGRKRWTHFHKDLKAVVRRRTICRCFSERKRHFKIFDLKWAIKLPDVSCGRMNDN